MRSRRAGSSWTIVALSLAAGVCLAAAPALARGVARAAATRYAQILEPCPAPQAGHATCFALVRRSVKAPTPGTAAGSGVRPYVIGGGAAAAGPAGGLTPDDLASAYGYSPTGTGFGQTVAIVDAFDDPAIESDLGQFDARYGLPPCTSANGCLQKVGQTGSASSLPAADEEGWSVEIALDVETVHAACPNCKILLVEANESSSANLAAAVDQAVALGATEVSNSYGGPELFDEASERAAYDHPGLPIVASTGDDGYYGWDWVNEFGPFEGDEMPSTPAALPSVVAVGGTTLDLNPDGTRAAETVWNTNGRGDAAGLASEEREGATGGGCSKLFDAQPWQRAVANFAAAGCGEKRLDADVSAVADPLTGLDIYDSYECGAPCNFPRVEGGWVTIGGTSLSAPLISSMYALAGGGRGVVDPALTLYGHAADASLRFDVTEGANGFCGGESTVQCGKPNSVLGDVDCEGTTACNAAPGFDGPSGIGTPKGLGLFEPLLPTAVISPPAALTAGSAASFSAGASSDPYPGGAIAAASWNWGDGTSGAGVSASHAYTAPGSYTVTLTVTDAYGLSSRSVGTMVGVAASQARAIAPVAIAAVGNSGFVIKRMSVNAKTGALALKVSVVDPGTFRWLATFPNGKFGAFASASKCKAGSIRLAGKCRPAKIVFAKGSQSVAGAGTVTITLKPSSSAAKALKNALKKGKALLVSGTLSFQSSRGGSRVSRALGIMVKLKK